MGLTTDKQTLTDLGIFENKGSDTIYQLFNRTSTSAGAEILEQMFRNPFAEEQLVNERKNIIKFFSAYNFPFRGGLFEQLEEYLRNTDDRTTYGVQANQLIRILNDFVGGQGHEHKLITNGVTAFVEIVEVFQDFIRPIMKGPGDLPYLSELRAAGQLMSEPDFDPFRKIKSKKRLSPAQIAELDKQIRFLKREKIKKILQHIYKIDVYIAVAKVADENGFVFPDAMPGNQHELHLDSCRHPLLKQAVPFNLRITPANNIIFLTGANMAGKSTFMKTLGINLYLAHMGFPVAAAGMRFSVMEGIFTTINLPDNLSMGYSHFYAEVLRIKKIAQELNTGKSLFIIFDELFRGTNVKDAYEATIALTEAFSEKQNCKFVISTHIVEAGEVLKERRDNINFLFMPTIMQGNKPIYTYNPQSGITEDRHGMLIINNEGILKLLEK